MGIRLHTAKETLLESYLDKEVLIFVKIKKKYRKLFINIIYYLI